jgi:hypothetical protein
VNRAISIVTGLPYMDVREIINQTAGKAVASTGVHKSVTRRIMADLGLIWVPVMGIGTGCKMHLHRDEVPDGRIVCQLSRHVTAVIDRVVYDAYDPSRGGTRCIYGYWTLDIAGPASKVVGQSEIAP